MMIHHPMDSFFFYKMKGWSINQDITLSTVNLPPPHRSQPTAATAPKATSWGSGVGRPVGRILQDRQPPVVFRHIEALLGPISVRAIGRYPPEV